MFEFKIWRDSHKDNDTLLVFVPGFLTQESVKNNETWVDELLLYASEKDYSIGSVLWPSSTPKSLLDINTFSINELSQNFVNKWHQTDQLTETIVSKLTEIAPYFKKKKTILLGHSLGAKIALKAVERSPNNTFHAVVAMAPACLPASCDFEVIRKKTKRKPIVLFSKKDKVLEFLFPTAQNQKNVLDITMSSQSTASLLFYMGAHYLINREKCHALGYSGSDSLHVNNIDTCELMSMSIGHLTYQQIARQILNKLKI